MVKLNPTVKTAWLEALQSGKYKQGRHVLKSHGEHCCLGVLCELHQLHTGVNGWETGPNGRYELYLGSAGSVPEPVRCWSGLTYNVAVELTVLNDRRGLSFKQIAGYIRRYL